MNEIVCLKILFYLAIAIVRGLEQCVHIYMFVYYASSIYITSTITIAFYFKKSHLYISNNITRANNLIIRFTLKVLFYFDKSQLYINNKITY